MSLYQENWDKLNKLLETSVCFPQSTRDQALRRSIVTPGAVVLVSHGGEVIYHRAFGCRSIIPEVTPLDIKMVFDVASLTKVIITTTLAMQLVDRGLLEVDRRLSRIFQTFGTHGKERITIRHLLTHTAGFPATAPFYKQFTSNTGLSFRSTTESIYNSIFRAKLDNLPGKVTKYSDIGFILLGAAVETVAGMTLDKLAVRDIIKPLKLSNTDYIDLTAVKLKQIEPHYLTIVPTAECPWRGKILLGEVHDDNAWAMGGIAGHAGIFSTAYDINLFATEMINCYYGKGSLVSQEVISQFWTRDNIDPQSTWALGWDTPTPGMSSSGRYFSPNSVGHLGFTGCSLWIDPKRELSVVILTNRIHPSPTNSSIQEFRPKVHNCIMEILGYC